MDANVRCICLKLDNSILKYVKNLKGKWAICLLAVVGVLLLLLGGGMSDAKDGSASENGYTEESERYRAELEDKISEICKRVSGDENPTVIVTLDCGEEYIYAKRSDGSYIISSGDGVLLRRMMPKVCGVAIVCRNGDESSVQSCLTEHICALLGIGTNRVCVSASR